MRIAIVDGSAEDRRWLTEQLEGLPARLLPAPEKYVELRSGRQSVRLRLGDILWAEHFQHQIRVHTAGAREVSTRLTFGEFSARGAFGDRLFQRERRGGR